MSRHLSRNIFSNAAPVFVALTGIGKLGYLIRSDNVK